MPLRSFASLSPLHREGERRGEGASKARATPSPHLSPRSGEEERDYTDNVDIERRFRYKGRSPKSWEASVLSLPFPSPRRPPSRSGRGETGGAYFSVDESVTFGNHPTAGGRRGVASTGVIFGKGGGLWIRGQRGRKCRWHRHPSRPPGSGLVWTLWTPWLREGEAASLRLRRGMRGVKARLPIFSYYFIGMGERGAKAWPPLFSHYFKRCRPVTSGVVCRPRRQGTPRVSPLLKALPGGNCHRPQVAIPRPFRREAGERCLVR